MIFTAKRVKARMTVFVAHYKSLVILLIIVQKQKMASCTLLLYKKYSDLKIFF